MASYISSWTPVLQSINPFTSSPTTSPLPAINSPAPSALGSLNLPSGTGHPVLVAFVRHCGCPFAEKEVKLLGAETSKHSDLHVVIVQHSEEKETQEWFERIGYALTLPNQELLIWKLILAAVALKLSPRRTGIHFSPILRATCMRNGALAC